MTHPIPSNKQLLSVGEAAKCLGIGRTKTHELVVRGDISSTKIGTRRLIARTSVNACVHGLLGPEEATTKDGLAALIEVGEVQAITLGGDQVASIDSLGEYLEGQTVDGVQVLQRTTIGAGPQSCAGGRYLSSRAER